MSLVAKLMIGGWITTLSMIGFFALSESGKLLRMRRRVAVWLETTAAEVVRPREDNLRAEREDVA